MAIDMNQFHEVFFEESQEHLDEMEQQLLSIDVSAPEPEQLNSIFRAAHSIKGGSGIFGFDALTRVTHVMESLLDLARNQKMALTTDIVDHFLTTVDTLKTILANYRAQCDQDDVLIGNTTETLQHLLADQQELIQHKADEQGYGFFAESATADTQDNSFGFFEPPTNNTDVTDDDGFGFFAPLAPNVESSTATQKSADAAIADVNPHDIGKVQQPTTTLSKDSAKAATNTESTSIRVDTNKVDLLVNMVGELVITQSMLSLIGQQVSGPISEKLQVALGELVRNTREIQDTVMSIRMLPISFVFNRFPRLVRDLSGKLGKQINLVIEGGNTEIDKGLIEKLSDPLTHLVRNSIDHGVEAPDKRIAAGKPAEGTVTLRAQHRGGNIQISIVDDGAGLNRDKILAKAIENNIPVAENPTDKDVWQLIFAPGFSTAEQVTDVSGRGVGMDVVKRNIASLGGHIDIESSQGNGAAFHISLPLTLAILDGMGVSVGDSLFVIPLVNIVESIQPERAQVKTIKGEYLLRVREEYWPLLCLYKEMALEPRFTQPEQGIVVLIESNSTRFGLFVDALEGQQQAVIKSLEKHYKRVPGVAGATIMGDGGVALILDVESLSKHVKHSLIKDLL